MASSGVVRDKSIAKVLVVGDVATGKTSFIQRFCRGLFTGSYQTTIGVDFALKTVTVDDEVLKMQLWDIAGQERFTGLARIYYKDAVGGFVVYDVSSRKTFDSVRKWKEDISQKVFLSNGDPIPVVLIGNKCDLGDSVRTVSEAEGRELAHELNFHAFYETSAKEDINIVQACMDLARQIYENQKRAGKAQQETEVRDQQASGNVTLTMRPDPSREPSTGCCGS